MQADHRAGELLQHDRTAVDQAELTAWLAARQRRPTAGTGQPDPTPDYTSRLASGLLGPLLRETVAQHLMADVPVALLLSGGVDSTAVAALDVLVRADLDRRAQARKDKDWAVADEVRDRLAEAGVEVTDTPDGAQWSLREAGA